MKVGRTNYMVNLKIFALTQSVPENKYRVRAQTASAAAPVLVKKQKKHISSFNSEQSFNLTSMHLAGKRYAAMHGGQPA